MDHSRETYDVFLCHNSDDKPVVRQLRDELQKREIRTWFDEDQLIPGRPWQEALERAIQSIKAAAICVGASGFAPWQNQEMRAYLQQFVNRNAAVIPVLLSGAPKRPELPVFLQAFTWVDLHDGITDVGLHRLICGIRGTPPGETPMVPRGMSPDGILNGPIGADDASLASKGFFVPEPGDPDELLPRIVQFLHELPEDAPELHDEIIRALRSEFPELPKQNKDGKPVDLVQVIDRKGLHPVLEALYCWLDRGLRPRISADGWREVLTHLVVLAAAKAWLRQARDERDRGGIVAVRDEGYPLQPLSAAVLVSGLFDVAVHLEGNRPTGYVEVSVSTGSKGYDVEDRYHELRNFLHSQFEKHLKRGSPSLNDDAIKEMLRSAVGQRRPLFMILPGDDALAETVSGRLEGLLTVLQEQATAPRVLDESLRLVKNIQDLLDKLQPAS
ncbi:MAG: TIR domain-containing protein [Pirellulaceae bacterium]|nr:TIR domain-containing protein [Pirellulaceae bacterium]